MAPWIASQRKQQARSEDQSSLLVRIDRNWLFRQRFALGFRGERQRQQANDEDAAHPDAGVPHWFRVACEDVLNQGSQGQRARGSHETPHVVTERRSGTAQVRRE